MTTVTACVIVSAILGALPLRAQDSPVVPVRDSDVLKPQPICSVAAPVPVSVSADFYEMLGPIVRTGGRALFQKGNERITADSVEYNTDTEAGVARDVFFTTCSNARTDWHVTASRATLLPNRKLHFRNVAVYIGGWKVLALPSMKARGWGRIVNVASAHALIASPFKSAYVAAKHGLAGFTKSVALEVATQGITVNAICPGYVKTPLVEAQIPDQARTRGISEEDVVQKIMLAGQPTRRFIGIDEVAALAAFLASDVAKSITGAMLSIDGGWTAQ